MATEPPKWLTQLFGWYAMTTLALGARSGLLDAVLLGPGTPAEIAARAGVEERNTLQWLKAMTAAGHLRSEDGRFELTEETRSVFGAGFPVSARAVVDFVDRTSELIPDVVAAMRSGAGVPPERFHDAYGDAVGRVNTPTYRSALVEEWIGSCEGLAGRLAAGGRIADLASGNGDAALMMARAFPAAEVTGYDLDASSNDAAARKARDAGLPNFSAVTGGADELREGTYTLVTCLDSLHHFGVPAAVAARAREALVDGGVFLVAETASTGSLEADAKNPFSVIVFTCGLLYCLQENLFGGGEGVTGGDGPAWVLAAFEAAGFTDVTTHESPTGYRIYTGRR